MPAYDGTLVAVRTADDSMSLNIGNLIEANIRVEEEQPATDDNHKQKAIDYTKYYKIIEEMKGE